MKSYLILAAVYVLLVSGDKAFGAYSTDVSNEQQPLIVNGTSCLQIYSLQQIYINQSFRNYFLADTFAYSAKGKLMLNCYKYWDTTSNKWGAVYYKIYSRDTSGRLLKCYYSSKPDTTLAFQKEESTFGAPGNKLSLFSVLAKDLTGSWSLRGRKIEYSYDSIQRLNLITTSIPVSGGGWFVGRMDNYHYVDDTSCSVYSTTYIQNSTNIDSTKSLYDNCFSSDGKITRQTTYMFNQVSGVDSALLFDQTITGYSENGMKNVVTRQMYSLVHNTFRDTSRSRYEYTTGLDTVTEKITNEIYSSNQWSPVSQIVNKYIKQSTSSSQKVIQQSTSRLIAISIMNDSRTNRSLQIRGASNIESVDIYTVNGARIIRVINTTKSDIMSIPVLYAKLKNTLVIVRAKFSDRSVRCSSIKLFN